MAGLRRHRLRHPLGRRTRQDRPARPLPAADRANPLMSTPTTELGLRVRDAVLVEDRHRAGVAVDPDPLPGLDPRGARRGPGDRRQTVLAAHDRRVRHDPADVRHGGPDLPEDRRPARRGERGHEDLARRAPGRSGPGWR